MGLLSNLPPLMVINHTDSAVWTNKQKLDAEQIKE